jgi:hypothetical protein
MRAHALPIHWTLLSCDDCARLALGAGIVDADFRGWLVLAIIILVGSKLIWWATERA